MQRLCRALAAGRRAAPRTAAVGLALGSAGGVFTAHGAAASADPHSPGLPDAENTQASGSWRLNLGRTSGYWGDARWYDHQIDRKLHRVGEMIEELVYALPPLPAGTRVADLCAGSGRAALALLRAYPEAHVTLVDMDTRRTGIAVEEARRLGLGRQVSVLEAVVDADAPADAVIDGGPAAGYHLITATCAIRVIANPPAHYTPPGGGSVAPAAESKHEAVARRYRQLFALALRSLAPGGHLIVGDHSGALGLYDQMRLMEEAGFTEVDVAWRSRDWFVCGGRRPLE